MSAMKKALAASDTPSYLKAAIAEGLGECPNPEARALLDVLIHDHDEIAARGAVRGLGARADAAGVATMGTLLFDAQTPLSIRTEAALVLGDVNLPAAQALLVSAVAQIQDESVLENVLAGLAKRPFADTQSFFTGYLGAANVSTEMKVAAIEALGNAQGDASPLLLVYLNNPDAAVRSAVAWALITTTAESDIAPQLQNALKQETDATVRTRLYQALENQSSSNPQALLSLIQNESDLPARLAGFDYLAGTVQSEATAQEVKKYFSQTAVTELQNTVLSSDNAQYRLTAILALRRARTSEAVAALETIVQKSQDPKVVQAARLP